jgi:alpha-methylacyl-CoA racemase
MDLDGVRVLELANYLPGPYATQVLADLGADVVKVERPDGGDMARAVGEVGPDVFGAVNRGKRSVALDLTDDADRAAFLDLAADADVVLESFRPGVVERLGVGYDAVAERDPGVVYCSLTGFGATGPNADRAGHDLDYVALAGMLDATRAEADGRPAIPGLPVADVAGGLYAALSVLGALLTRELGDGGGEHLDVAMTDAVVAMQGSAAPGSLAGGEHRAREAPLTGGLPCYDVYETADGEYLVLAALEPTFWGAFCEAVDRPELLEAHLSADPDERAALREELRALFRERPREAWLDDLDGVDAAVAPVRTVGEAVESPQVRERGLVVDGPAGERVGFPVRSSAGTPGTDERVPDLGEHTDRLVAGDEGRWPGDSPGGSSG